MLNHNGALIETMFFVAASDGMTEAETHIIGEIVAYLPIFADYDRNQLSATLEECAQLIAREDGLERGLEGIKRALPKKLYETAYALACDVVAVDGAATQEELRILELLRDALDLDRLHAAAIERGARARFMRL